MFFAAETTSQRKIPFLNEGLVQYTPHELFRGLLDRRQVAQIHLDEMEVVLSSFFLQFLNGSISLRLGPSEDVYCCIFGEELLENESTLRRSLSEKDLLADF